MPEEQNTQTEQTQAEQDSGNQAPQTYTAEQYESATKAQHAAGFAAAMKEAGFEPDKTADFKTQMDAFKAWQDSQKTELQKAADGQSAAEKSLAEERSKREVLERRFDAVSQGVPADKADQYVALARSYVDDKTDFSAALKKAIADFPIPGSAGGAKTPSYAARTTSSGGADDEATYKEKKYGKNPWYKG